MNAMSEVQLLTGAIPSLILPLIAFGASATQKRYRKEYFTCLATNGVDLDEDDLLVALRLMQCLFYAYSLIYFFLLAKTPDELLFRYSGVLFLFTNFMVFVAGIYSFVISKNTKCGDTMFSSLVTI